MRNSDKALSRAIEKNLLSFENIQALPGISGKADRACLIEQIIDSTRRVRYVRAIASMNISKLFTNSSKKTFDPLKAAVWHHQNGNIDEAFWLTFLATHFGKNKKTGWELLRNVYNGESKPWTWKVICTNVKQFRSWLDKNNGALKLTGNFSNHRKYESLNGLKSNGTGAAIQSYIDWIGHTHKHKDLINKVEAQAGAHPKDLFNSLYHSMSSVARFGRTGKFDYLTMIGKLGLVKIEPPSTYMSGATGPVRGAQLLFTGTKGKNKSARDLEGLLNLLEPHLNLDFGMQILEDALCNWQKSPNVFIHFSG